ncbi:MAG: glycosyltransferase [Chloroflexi bacterium]|nr:glycosyltransferase [Chloroflexota bacterium]
MYPLDQGAWGPTVRIAHLRRELAQLVDLDVVAGYRGPRRRALARYAVSGRLRGLDGIYVESSSFLPAEADYAFAALARALGIPILTYIRDAYQLFPEYYDTDTRRRKFSARLFMPAMRGLERVSTALAFPSRGLAEAVLGERAAQGVILPPGAPNPVHVRRERDARSLLFVGDARLPAQGGDRLVDAVRLARDRGANVELTVVSRHGQEPLEPHPPWLHVIRAQGPEIERLLPSTLAAVIPRPRNAYNDLAVPIKLMDYLAYGRPLVVTDCLEQADVVRKADAGIIVNDSVSALCDGIVTVAGADGAQLDRWSVNAQEWARHASWAMRAASIVRWFRSLQ